MITLGISTLSAGWQAFLYGTALVLFLLDATGLRLPNARGRLLGLGLAVFVFVFFWNAIAAT